MAEDPRAFELVRTSRSARQLAHLILVCALPAVQQDIWL